MPASHTEGNSILAIDIGEINTRAAYFDVIEGSYRLIGIGQSPTTAYPPVRNSMVGIQLAVENLQAVIGKALMNDDGDLIIPSQPDGHGVDSMVTSLSAGPAIKTLLVGLLPDFSLRSIETLAQSTYIRVVDSLHLNDPRRADDQVDAIMRANPDLVLIAGGVDNGATHSIQKVLDVLGLGIYLLPESNRPEVLYAGNKEYAQNVQNALVTIASQVYLSPNIRPELELEDLAPAQRRLADIVVNIRQKQMPELEQVRSLSGGTILPSAYAQGRMARFLSSYFGAVKSVLSIDVGASAISLSASFNGELHLSVFPELGLGQATAELLEYTTLEDIVRWLPVEIPAESVCEYLYQKSIYPGAIPTTKDELAIEQALVRQNLQTAIRWMLPRLPERWRSRNGLLPSFEPILVGGGAITGAANPAQKLLMLLDGLQPTGITTFALDQNNLLAMLGAVAEVNSLVPVQALDSGVLSYLATVVSPVSSASPGAAVLQAKLIKDDGSELAEELNMGDIKLLPLEPGENARLQLRPVQRTDVGLGPGRAGEVDVSGSALGIVLDGRGRPLRLAADAAQRHALAQKWLASLEG